MANFSNSPKTKISSIADVVVATSASACASVDDDGFCVTHSFSCYILFLSG